jgi:MSHA biogenesis protein MshN
MSLINRMLQDLDRREALDAGEAKAVRVSSSAKPARSEWFWRILVVLLTAALAWTGWVAIQLLPRKPLVTELAYRAASDALGRSEPKPAAPAPVAQIVLPTPAAPVAEPAVAVAVPPLPPSNDSLRLETELRTPLAERAAPVAEKPKLAAAAPPAAKRPKERLSTAETHFRRATVLLKDARVGEAEEHLQAALQADQSHTEARQAYVSLLLEQQRISTARGLLLDTLGADPAQAPFALALARIYAMGRDYAGALAVLDRAASGGQTSADFQAFRGAMLQRLGRHEEALVAYQNSVREGTPPATAWIGYAISLEAVGKRSEAAQAYRQALTTGSITAEAREYAESRARALE